MVLHLLRQALADPHLDLALVLLFAVVWLIAVCQSRARREDNNKE